jgi:transcriptional regulator with XRE-family HTH domain
MSQAALAEHLGVTFQQVQKYEKGMDRVVAGRLTKIAAVLGVPVSELLGDGGTGQTNRRAVAEARSPLKLLTPLGALKLLWAYARINDGHQRLSPASIMASAVVHWLIIQPRYSSSAMRKPRRGCRRVAAAPAEIAGRSAPSPQHTAHTQLDFPPSRSFIA